MGPCILVDLDGVFSNFVHGALRRFGAEMERLDWPPGLFRMTQVLGVSSEKFWRTLDVPEFWMELEPYPWTAELRGLLDDSQTPWWICTSPSGSPHSAHGKVHWMNRHLGDGEPFRRYFICRDKWVLAKPDRVLIDDSDENCERFREAGGNAIVFPQHWNSMSHVADPLEHVRRGLRDWSLEHARRR